MTLCTARSQNPSHHVRGIDLAQTQRDKTSATLWRRLVYVVLHIFVHLNGMHAFDTFWLKIGNYLTV